MSIEFKKLATKAVHSRSLDNDPAGAVMPPIYPSTVYVQQELGEPQEYMYSRVSNPTRRLYEQSIADLESGKFGFAFASGIAAIAAIIDLLDAGSHLLVTNQVYGGTYGLIEQVKKRTSHLHCQYIDMTNLANIETSIRPNTKMIWIESPSNPLLRVLDLPAIAKIARKHDILSVIDNTFATPYIQRPLELGYDIVVHSATKYLNGHSDVVSGVVVIGDNKILAEQIGLLQRTVGSVPSPFDCYLALRGVRTLAVRMERHCSNALQLAEWLEKHFAIERVFYPGLPSHPEYELAKRQMANKFGGVVSIYVKGGYAATKRFLERCRLFTLTGSLGGIESLIGHPLTMSHRSMSKEMLDLMGVTDNLVRLSVGIEDIDDLKADLEQALK